MKFIVAQNYQRYLWWCREQNPPLNPRGPQVRYVTDARVLRGLSNIDYLCLNGWMDRPDWRDIYHELLIRGGRQA